MKKFYKSLPICLLLVAISFLSIALCYSVEINNWATSKKDFLNLTNSAIDFLIAIGLLFLGWEANQIAQASRKKAEQDSQRDRTRLQESDRVLFRENYKKVSDALGMIMRDGGVKDEAIRLIWEARDQARLELPKDVMEFTEKLRSTAQKAWVNRRICWDEKGSPKEVNDKQKFMDKMHKAEKELFEIDAFETYRPHMALGEKNN